MFKKRVFYMLPLEKEFTSIQVWYASNVVDNYLLIEEVIPLFPLEIEYFR